MSYLRATTKPITFSATTAPLLPLQSTSTITTVNTVTPTQDVSSVESTWQDGTWLVTKASLKFTGLTFIGLTCLLVIQYYRRKRQAGDLEQQQEYARQLAIQEEQSKASNVKQNLKIVKWKDISVSDDTDLVKRDESTNSTASVHSDDDIEAQTASKSDCSSNCSLSVSDIDDTDTSVSAPKSVSETISDPELRGADDDDDDDDDDEDKCCSICLAHFESNELVAMSNNVNCKHIFHKDCITSWLVKQDGCPFCRRPYLEAEEVKVECESDNIRVNSPEMAA
jgi:Ring finger domain